MITSSVLLPTWRRPQQLLKCLTSLNSQTLLPSEVLIVWQADDTPSFALANEVKSRLAFPVRVFHSEVAGIVPAEMVAYEQSHGSILLLIDDDAVAPPTWVERHLRHYSDPCVGIVGGEMRNFHTDGTPFPKRTKEPVGRLTLLGRSRGNMYDHCHSWCCRSPMVVDHVVGCNMSVRREALGGFETALKPYWQMFELDACLSVKRNGYKVLFDFANPVDHYPTNTVFSAGRSGDLKLKSYNSAYNHALILSKHSRPLLRPLRLAYCLLCGSISSPGLLAAMAAVRRFGNPARECAILANTTHSRILGWAAGKRLRQRLPRIAEQN